MQIISKIREYSFYLSSFGGLGKVPGGSMLATLIALPIVFVGRLLYLFFPKIYYWCFVVLTLLAFALTQLSLDAHLEEFSSSIVIDKVIGMMLALAFLPIDFEHWQIIFFSFVLFHALRLLKPVLLMNNFFKKIEVLPGALGLMAFDLMFGLVTNASMHVTMLFYK